MTFAMRLNEERKESRKETVSEFAKALEAVKNGATTEDLKKKGSADDIIELIKAWK